MKETFEQIALEENAKLHVDHDKHMAPTPRTGVGGTIFTTTYTLVVSYKGYSMRIENEFGGPDVGSVVCELPEQPEINEVEVVAKGALFKIFKPKHLLCFSVNTKNRDLKTSLENNHALFVLSDFVRSTPFCPIIIGKNRKGRYELSTHYHLGIKERRVVVRPIIDFYKQFIDYLG